MLFIPQLATGEERGGYGGVHANDSNWKHVRCSCTKFQWIASWWGKCSHLGLRAPQEAKLSQWRLSCCITLLTMYEVFNPTLLLAFFQFTFTFGLSIIGLGNVGWTIGLFQALVIIVVLNSIGGKAKLIGVLCPKMWKLDGIAQLFPSSNVFP